MERIVVMFWLLFTGLAIHMAFAPIVFVGYFALVCLLASYSAPRCVFVETRKSVYHEDMDS